MNGRQARGGCWQFSDADRAVFLNDLNVLLNARKDLWSMPVTDLAHTLRAGVVSA